MRQLIFASRLGRTEYQLLLMKISWWDRNVKIRYKCLVVIDEFLTVLWYQPNEFISWNLSLSNLTSPMLRKYQFIHLPSWGVGPIAVVMNAAAQLPHYTSLQLTSKIKHKTTTFHCQQTISSTAFIRYQVAINFFPYNINTYITCTT